MQNFILRSLATNQIDCIWFVSIMAVWVRRICQIWKEANFSLTPFEKETVYCLQLKMNRYVHFCCQFCCVKLLLWYDMSISGFSQLGDGFLSSHRSGPQASATSNYWEKFFPQQKPGWCRQGEKTWCVPPF